MQMTKRLLALLLATALPLAAGLWLPDLIWLAVAWLLGVAVIVITDLRLTPVAASWEITRHHDERLSLAVWNPITLTLRRRGDGRALRVWLRDTPPATFGITEADRLLMTEIAGGATTTLTYQLRPPRRGDYQFGDLYLRWNSALGLVRRQTRYPATEAVKVYPNLAEVKKYDLMLRRSRLAEYGLRATRLRGSGTEFERLRDYQPDDEYRRISWKATARRNKPISVDYQTERSQNLVALLDIGRMMRSPVGDVAKLDYAINAVLLLAYVAAQKGDKLGLLTFADQPQTWLAPRAGRGQFLRMLEHLYAVESQPVEPNYQAAVAYLAAKHAKRSLILLFTDLTGNISTANLVAQMGRLRRQHLPLVVTIGDPTVEHLADQSVIDSESLYQRTVAQRLLDERALVIEQLRSRGVLTLDVAADRLSLAVIDQYLALKARTLL